MRRRAPAQRVASASALQFAAYDHLRARLYESPLALTEARFRQLESYLDARESGAIAKGDPSNLRAEFGDRGLPMLSQVQWTSTGVAIVPIQATFARDLGPVDSVSGFASYDDTLALLEDVAADARTRGIVLAINSPGGEAIGASDAMHALDALSNRKLIYSALDPMAASAAYWLVAPSAQIFIPKDGTAGSIGTFIAREDNSKAEAAAGRTLTIVRSGPLKGLGDERTPLSEEERAVLQARVDQVAGLMFADVAAMRELDPSAVAAFGGGAFVGQKAIDAGLADQIGTWRDAVAAMESELAGGGMTRRMRSHITAATAPQSQEATMSTETTQQAAAPSNVVSIDEKKIREEATAAATAAMQARTEAIVGLCALAKCPERAAAFLADAKLSADDVRNALAAEATKADAETAISSQTNARRAGDGSGVTIDTAAIYARRSAGYQQARDRRAQQVRAAIGQ